MKVGKMDGFCVGEPWNDRAIADGIGFTAITTQEMWKDHPEKVCAFTEEFADEESEDGEGGAQGAARGQRLARQDGEPAEAAPKSSRGRPTSTARRRSSSGGCWASTTTATAATEQDPNYMIFSNRDCNYPQPDLRARGGSRSSAAGAWSRARRTTPASPSGCMRPDIYLEAMKEIGVDAEDRRGAEGHALRRRHVRRQATRRSTRRSFAIHSMCVT